MKMDNFVKNVYRVMATLTIAALLLLVGVGSYDIKQSYKRHDMSSSVVQAIILDKDGKDAGHGTAFYVGHGYYITAAHVAGTNSSMVLEDKYGGRFTANVIKVSKTKDVAIMYTPYSIPGIGEATLKCNPIFIGEEITAVGYPLTLGYVETYGRVISNMSPWGNADNYYRVDAVIAPGMSGGPVFDNSGEVIGLNSAIALVPLGFGASISGIGLVVPSTEICKMMLLTNPRLAPIYQ